MKTEPVGYTIIGGKNLPNHSTSMEGRGTYVRVTSTSSVSVPTFRTRQEAFRVCAAILRAVEEWELPNEDEDHEFEDILEEVMPTMDDE